ncbi:MAG TPA: CDP-alcohol phosphatidyltransferase family protein [Acidimicrobiales bacterium]|nr:CDP-alcohol phosphatidyltransferase family protein [Acidimicrobiales bacterium]
MFDGRWRTGVDRGVKPVGDAIRRTGITANHLTAAGLVMAGVTAVAIGSGHLAIGFALLVLAAVPDLLDGAVAKASGTASPRGAFFDSVADRVTDTLVLGGIAWHLAVTKGGVWPMLPFAVLGVSTLISYERAKAESLGYQAKGGIMERAERIIALCAGLAFPVLLVPVLWVMLALTTFTAVQRFVKVWRQASATAPRRERPPTRLQMWRESSGGRVVDWRAAAQRRRERPRRARRRTAARRP